MEETENLIEKRKEKLTAMLKQKKDWAIYIILSFIVFISIYIRTRNISKLKDITTGTWTLGPDLDPFLFLRWAEYIVENGKLMTVDTMRYFPLGFNTSGEMKLLAYMIDWWYHILSFFSRDATVTYAAVLFPVAMAALTAIAFFLFAREIFYKENKITKNSIGLIATAFFVLIPSLLPRTIAGIPEKESAAFFFMFLAFYFFIKALTLNKLKNKLIFGIFAGASTAGMGLIWGGVLFIFFTIPSAFLISFLLGKIDRKQLFIYLSWIITSFLVMMPFSTRYTAKNLIMSLSTGFATGVFVLVAISLIIIKNNKFDKIKNKIKVPKELFSLIISIFILLIIISIIFGPNFVFSQIGEIKSSLITPIGDRFGMTVAENKQPYFANDWKDSFGPVFLNIPLYFWMFFAGAVILFNNLIVNLNKKEKVILTFSYFTFLFCLIFSRYSPGSIFDGVSGLSLTVYFFGWIFFLGSFVYIYFKRHKEGEFETFKNFNLSYILYFITFTLGLIGARGGVRLIMVLGAVSPVAVSFLIVKVSQKYLKEKDEMMKFFMGILALIIILSSFFTIWTYYNSDKAVAENFAPGPYQWQWQKAMAWVRENTSTDAVFAHWWDYGYWLQSIGERTTILDGGNAIGYWNHFMGRHVLTGPDEKIALEFLYAHNGTHLLIDSTDIGKYTAFSSIGSDVNYDRFSWISTFLMNDGQTQETINETVYVYTGGFMLDEDLIIEDNGKEIFLPKKIAGIGAVILKEDKEGNLSQPEVIFVYNNNQYRKNLRYAYFDGEFYDFGSGLDAGIFIFPRIDALSNGKLNLNKKGALMYLSSRTVHSQLAKLYLFDRESNYFKLVHTEPNLFIENLRNQGLDIGELVYYQGVQGPIKIWEISYPSNIKLNETYLETGYPSELTISKSGEYG